MIIEIQHSIGVLLISVCHPTGSTVSTVCSNACRRKKQLLRLKHIKMLLKESICGDPFFVNTMQGLKIHLALQKKVWNTLLTNSGLKDILSCNTGL
jgi:hypothetical protein